jgi:protein phosphatase
MVRLHCGSVSIVGNFRDNNEDACLIDSQGRYLIVADGMGGQAAGEKASSLATELVPQKLEQLIDFDSDESEKVLSSIDEAVQHANLEIMALGEIDPNFNKMGTTITFLISVAGKLYVGGVGDSRVYRLRGDEFQQLTKDHSLTQALVDAGTITEEEAETHRYKNVLYRYLGTKEGGTGTESTVLDPQSGDRFVLCSDGVTDGLKPESLPALLSEHDDPQAAAQAIVQAAQDGGSKDNITCLVVNVE